MIYRQLTAIPAGSALTIGNFDGVHAGHQLLIERVVSAKQHGASAACVIIFEPHPRDFFTPPLQPTRIMTFAQKYRILRELGVDKIFCLSFNQGFAAQSYQQFWQKIQETIAPSYLVLGADFRFGYKRMGSIAYIQEQAAHYHYRVDVISDHMIRGERVSSTRLRQLLEQHDYNQYQVLTGRTLTWQGKGQWSVEYGYHTLRLAMPQNQFPGNGVYVVQVENTKALAYLYAEKQRRVVAVYWPHEHGLHEGGSIKLTWLAYMRGASNDTEKPECRAQISRDMECYMRILSDFQ